MEKIIELTKVNPSKVKYLILVLSIMLCLMAAISIFTNQQSLSFNQTTPIPQLTTSPAAPLVSPIDANSEFVDQNGTEILVAPEFTGVKDGDVSVTIPSADEQAIQLRKQLPIETDDFTLTFDYDNDQFIFTKKINSKEINAQDWLINHNASSIPLEKIRVE